jgi:hypothetical protein
MPTKCAPALSQRIDDASELSDLVGGWSDAPRKYTAWVRRAPDDALIEEPRRRGIPIRRWNLEIRCCIGTDMRVNSKTIQRWRAQGCQNSSCNGYIMVESGKAS